MHCTSCSSDITSWWPWVWFGVWAVLFVYWDYLTGKGWLYK